MFRLRRKIYGMAVNRSKAITELDSLSNQLCLHVAKCVIFENTLNCLGHWINEIAIWLNKANRIQCKSKLKRKDYEDTLFGFFGNDAIDAENMLDYFDTWNVNHDYQYPKFDIDNDLIIKMERVADELKQMAIPILLSGNTLAVSEWYSKLESIL